ncbi:WbqC family protein [Pontibacter indicus]|uniref:WbqC-like protein family protein n=1 Tax=Pontibacter indicus TaxID=1317125 RepID=A0A1R3XQX0_9BACT|nr:WbqC family protein [Pontibacter indicus]SIT93823.1 WbqC-like protein family protein [Pontibacter indicus]
MKLAIMQPYFFPYIGYFQLINSVDKFIVYDDVTFIKQGWINRNNILLNRKPHLFTVPLESASSFNFIKDTRLNQKFYSTWAEKFTKTLEQNYKRAPLLNATMTLVEEVLSTPTDTVSGLALKSLTLISDYLGINTEIIPSSVSYGNTHLKGQARVLDICKQEHALHYINPIGGQELYSKGDFLEHGLKLNFIKPNASTYRQFDNDEFVPWLSIIDVLMFNDRKVVRQMLEDYELI